MKLRLWAYKGKLYRVTNTMAHTKCITTGSWIKAFIYSSIEQCSSTGTFRTRAENYVRSERDFRKKFRCIDVVSQDSKTCDPNVMGITEPVSISNKPPKIKTTPTPSNGRPVKGPWC